MGMDLPTVEPAEVYVEILANEKACLDFDFA